MVAYTQGLMDLGATVCTKSSPTCMLCPVAADCKARVDGRIDEIPGSKPTKPLPHKTQRYLLALHADSVLLVKRPPHGIWGGLWCLPELPNESPAETLEPVIATKLALKEIASIAPHPGLDHTFTHFKLTLLPLRVNVARIGLRADEGGSIWLPLADADRAALPKPIKTLLLNLRER